MFAPMLTSLIKQKLRLPERSVDQVLSMLNEGATVPFIARYRKERTGSLDEVQIAAIQKELQVLQKLIKRKETILTTIQEQGKLSPQIEKEIQDCWDPTLLEDIYLPFKKGRKTKADVAIEQGLLPLAKIISAQRSDNLTIESKRFIKGDVKTIDDALSGARHIIATWMNENIDLRSTVRGMYERYATLECKVITKKKVEAIKYKDYFDYAGALHKTPSHRLLAIYRGEEEGLLRVKITIDIERAAQRYDRYYIKSRGECAKQLSMTIDDALKRLILPSIENEFKKIAKEKADTEAIDVFANNLRQLLLASPLGEFPILALDPGFRTGCKLVVLDDHGNLVHRSAIYPHPPQSQGRESLTAIIKLLQQYKVRHIAIGNGTAGRESYQWLMDNHIDAELYMVNESGASIYSASDIAREEFPDEDITVRGAVSIGRRLMDPLAELVKLDAKSIGVGQYQHDVNQTQLKESLDHVVMSCVNAVGTNLNTASKHLLQYVSGIGPSIAQNIVDFRFSSGGFQSRDQLLEVPRMGKKAFEQAAGFLRVKEGNNLLDNTGVHPERYRLVRRMLSDYKIDINQLDSAGDQLSAIDLNRYVDDEVGLPTLRDIVAELQKPGLDPRGLAQPVTFSARLKSIEDVQVGMQVNGVINNLTKFGAFVDIGIKASGLIHISQITDRFIKDPAEVLSLNQEVSATVLEVDISRKRISLTLKS